MELQLTDERLIDILRQVTRHTPVDYILSSAMSYMIVIHEIDLAHPETNKRMHKACKTIINERKLLDIIC
jgi:ABC-type molybdate transport system substrate-binding protein